MRVNIFLLLAAGILGYGLTLAFDQMRPATPVQKQDVNVADTVFTDLNGTQHVFRDLKGKIVIVNFWATWCPPCVVEFPALLEAAGNNPEDVVLVALSADLKTEDIERFLQKLSADIPGNALIGLDEHQFIAQKVFGTFKLPETYILDRNLQTHTKLIGANWEPEDLQNIIETLR